METGSAAGTVVLVHGGFVDGSGWQGVYDQLRKDGYKVSVVQNPTVSHAHEGPARVHNFGGGTGYPAPRWLLWHS
jgi:hypothetical protein